MNKKTVLNITGKALSIEGLLLLLPALVSVIYAEAAARSFFAAAAVTTAFGMALKCLTAKTEGGIFEREGFATVALSWILLSAFGALPYVMSGDIPHYTDAFFETVSGFTTTGASALSDVESLSHASLFWKGMTHWLGGMGILVFVIMFGSKTSNQSMQILKAEIPGPVVGKLVPRARDTARALYVIYFGITFIEVVLLLLNGMNLFDAVFHAMATAGTGGFGTKNTSLAGFGFGAQWVITVFMILFGVNFNLYYYILKGEWKLSLKNRELWLYICVIAASTLFISADLAKAGETLSDSVRLSAFQVASIISTTGFSTANFDAWPVLSKFILFVLMFFGGCAGSTAGGLKASRVLILGKSVKAELARLLRPRRSSNLSMEGKRLEDSTVRSVSTFFCFYMAIFMFGAFLITLIEGADAATAFSASAACINNVGPGFGAVGPAASYAGFTNISKILLSLEMLIGRLEIYPIILTFSVNMWKSK